MLEIVRRGTHCQRLLRDGAHHGQHVADTVIELLDQRALMRFGLNDVGHVDEGDEHAIDDAFTPLVGQDAH